MSGGWGAPAPVTSSTGSIPSQHYQQQQHQQQQQNATLNQSAATFVPKARIEPHSEWNADVNSSEGGGVIEDWRKEISSDNLPPIISTPSPIDERRTNEFDTNLNRGNWGEASTIELRATRESSNQSNNIDNNNNNGLGANNRTFFDQPLSSSSSSSVPPIPTLPTLPTVSSSSSGGGQWKAFAKVIPKTTAPAPGFSRSLFSSNGERKPLPPQEDLIVETLGPSRLAGATRRGEEGPAALLRGSGFGGESTRGASGETGASRGGGFGREERGSSRTVSTSYGTGVQDSGWGGGGGIKTRSTQSSSSYVLPQANSYEPPPHLEPIEPTPPPKGVSAWSGYVREDEPEIDPSEPRPLFPEWSVGRSQFSAKNKFAPPPDVRGYPEGDSNFNSGRPQVSLPRTIEQSQAFPPTPPEPAQVVGRGWGATSSHTAAPIRQPSLPQAPTQGNTGWGRSASQSIVPETTSPIQTQTSQTPQPPAQTSNQQVLPTRPQQGASGWGVKASEVPPLGISSIASPRVWGSSVPPSDPLVPSTQILNRVDVETRAFSPAPSTNSSKPLEEASGWWGLEPTAGVTEEEVPTQLDSTPSPISSFVEMENARGIVPSLKDVVPQVTNSRSGWENSAQPVHSPSPSNSAPLPSIESPRPIVPTPQRSGWGSPAPTGTQQPLTIPSFAKLPAILTSPVIPPTPLIEVKKVIPSSVTSTSTKSSHLPSTTRVTTGRSQSGRMSREEADEKVRAMKLKHQLHKEKLERIQREEEEYLAIVAAEAAEIENMERLRRAEIEEKKQAIIDKQARGEAHQASIDFERQQAAAHKLAKLSGRDWDAEKSDTRSNYSQVSVRNPPSATYQSSRDSSPPPTSRNRDNEEVVWESVPLEEDRLPPVASSAGGGWGSPAPPSAPPQATPSSAPRVNVNLRQANSSSGSSGWGSKAPTQAVDTQSINSSSAHSAPVASGWNTGVPISPSSESSHSRGVGNGGGTYGGGGRGGRVNSSNSSNRGGGGDGRMRGRGSQSSSQGSRYAPITSNTNEVERDGWGHSRGLDNNPSTTSGWQ